jgi:hypothetical protein
MGVALKDTGKVLAELNQLIEAARPKKPAGADAPDRDASD